MGESLSCVCVCLFLCLCLRVCLRVCLPPHQDDAHFGLIISEDALTQTESRLPRSIHSFQLPSSYPPVPSHLTQISHPYPHPTQCTRSKQRLSSPSQVHISSLLLSSTRPSDESDVIVGVLNPSTQAPSRKVNAKGGVRLPTPHIRRARWSMYPGYTCGENK